MSPRRVTVAIRFWTQVPDGDLEADEFADDLADTIARAVDALPDVAEGSTSVVDWTDDDGED